MSLTKKTRTDLPDSDFAVPKKRQLPINDEKHVRMAWDMVEHTKDLTPAEKTEARDRILERAKRLGMDTSGWHKLKAIAWEVSSLEAMSLETPSTPDHPNKIPFSGILVHLDSPSDKAPHGSFGKKIILTSAAATAALPTLLGMAVNYASDFEGHNPRMKIGIIDNATIENSAVRVSGFLYGADFANEVEHIQSNKEDLGFSFEAQRILVEDLSASPLVIKELVFTGAAVLQKKSAAYMKTSLAASAEEAKEKEMEETLKKILEQLGVMQTDITALKASAAADPQKKALEAATIHAAALNKTADDLEAAGIGGTAHIRTMAAQILADAAQGKTPVIKLAASAVAVVDPAQELKMKALEDGIAGLVTTVKDLGVKLAAAAVPPERKGINSRLTALLAKGSVTLPDGSEKMSVAKLDGVLKGTSLTPQERIEIKVGLERAGLLAAA